jgi:hypothetical protein
MITYLLFALLVVVLGVLVYLNHRENKKRIQLRKELEAVAASLLASAIELKRGL